MNETTELLSRDVIGDLHRAAKQADAHGHTEVARWYRCWAATGSPIGPKPDHTPRDAIYNGPVS